MSSPFDPQALTPAQQQQVADNASGKQLVKLVLNAMLKAKAEFAAAQAVSIELTHQAQIKEAEEVDVNGLIAQEEKYMALQDLVRNLGYYLGGAQGWRFGVGQPKHETFGELQTRLAGLYPDANAYIIGFSKSSPVVVK
jgi:hypothetical protein